MWLVISRSLKWRTHLCSCHPSYRQMSQLNREDFEKQLTEWKPLLSATNFRASVRFHELKVFENNLKNYPFVQHRLDNQLSNDFKLAAGLTTSDGRLKSMMLETYDQIAADPKDKLLKWSLIYNWIKLPMVLDSKNPLKTVMTETCSQLMPLGKETELTSHEIVFWTFLSGLYWPFPGSMVKGSRYTPDDLAVFDVFEQNIVKAFYARLNFEEVGVISHGLYKAKVLLMMRNADALNQLILTSLLETSSSDPIAVTSHVKNLFWTKPKLVSQDQLRRLFLKMRDQQTINNKIRLAQFLVKFPDHYGDLRSTFRSVQFQELRLKDLQKLINILIYIDYQGPLFEEVGRHLGKVHLKDVKMVKAWIYIMAALASKNAYNAECLDKLFSAANRWTTSHKSMRFQLLKKLCDKEPAELSVRDMGDPTWNTSIGSIAILDCQVDIQLKEYSGARLRPDVRQTLLQYVSRSTHGKRFEIPVKISTFLRQKLGTEYVYLRHLTPYSTLKSVVFCWDAEAQTVREPPCEFLDQLEDSLEVVSPPKPFVYFAVVVCSGKHFDLKMNLNGLGKVYPSTLEALGYQVVPVSNGFEDVLDAFVRDALC